MTSRFMVSVAAAALIAGAGFAYAQGTGEKGAPGSTGSAIQQNAPSSPTGGASAAPTTRDATEPGGLKSTQSDQKSPGAAKSKSAQDNMKAGPKSDKSAQDHMKDNAKGERSKSMSSENEKGSATKDRDMKAEGRDGMKAEGRDGNKNAESKGATERSQTTTGQAGGGARLSGEQRTRITSVIRDQRVEPLANANFSIVVGARVPRNITFYPLPAEVVTIYPEWRGYEFVRVRDQILVINPRTLEIVAVLEA
jgi:Protein of unknown function (DUF1236)